MIQRESVVCGSGAGRTKDGRDAVRGRDGWGRAQLQGIKRQ